MRSKLDGSDLGWFLATVQSKFYVKKTRHPGWRYNVVLSDGDAEDVCENVLTESIKKAKIDKDLDAIAKDLDASARPSPKQGQQQQQQQGQCSGRSSSSNNNKNNTQQKKGVVQQTSSTKPAGGEEGDDNNDNGNGNGNGNDNGSNNNDDDESSGDEDGDSSSEDESVAEERDPNEENIPHWNGKEHDRFFLGLLWYGMGNLEEIHEADCIPTRSYRELVRYWKWYYQDLERKGIDLDYDRKGTVNGRKGTRWCETSGDQEEETEGNDNDNNKNKDGKKEEDRDSLRIGAWTDWEKDMVVTAYVFHGGSYKEMSEFVKTRTPSQICGYFLHNKGKIKREARKYLDQNADAGVANKNENHRDAKLQEVDSNKNKNTISIENGAAVGGSNNTNNRGRSRSVNNRDGGSDNNVAKSSDVTVHDNGHRSWTLGEQEVLVSAIVLYGKNYNGMSTYMKSRRPQQIRKYAKRHTQRLASRVEEKAKDNTKRTKLVTKQKEPHNWSDDEKGLLVEAHALYGHDYETIAAYIVTRTADQVEAMLKKEADQFRDDSDFDLGYWFTFPDELYHVLNIAPYEKIDHILSWSEDGTSFRVHDEEKLRAILFPKYSHRGASSDRFYSSLKRFNFKQAVPLATTSTSTRNNNKVITTEYSHPSFQRGNYKKVLQMPHQLFSSSG